jgi:hypothetical protein
MNTTRTRIALAGALASGILALSGGAASAGPTCSGLGGIANHGQHVVGDYVIGESGIGSGLTWPYAGQVGAAVAANGGAAVPGGPGPGYHFPNDVAPGASFCTDSHSGGR